MAKVRIVTDSAADLPEDVAASRGIRIVPLTVRFGQETFTSGVDLTTDQFWKKLASSNDFPSTAAPSAGDFEEAYRGLASEGAEEILSIHISSKLSATYQAATVAAKELSGEITVHPIDTLGVSAAEGLMALRAADMADEGASAADILAALEALRERFKVVFVIDTLEYLRRGGRIGGAQALLGTMLKVKPVLGLVGGVVEPVGRVRTRAKSLEHLAALVAEHADRIAELYVVHANAPDIDDFIALIAKSVDVQPERIWTLGPVVGAHTGPGVIGTAFTTTA